MTKDRTPPTYEPGNVVYLLSGSCRMTVEKVDDQFVHCVWQHYESKEILRGAFLFSSVSKSQG